MNFFFHRHPMLPTQEQLTEWDSERFDEDVNFDVMMVKAFRAGADQELEACCEWLASETPEPYINALRLARRPKPKSEGLSEEALKELDWLESVGACNNTVIRRALKRLQELEGQANG